MSELIYKTAIISPDKITANILQFGSDYSRSLVNYDTNNKELLNMKFELNP